MEGAPFVEPKNILLVDDTAASGREMAANLPIVRERFPEARITRAVVYCHPQALGAVDMVAAVYPGAHYLEWNWNNAGHGAACAYDFDGILCRDFTAEECLDEASYRAAMASMPPRYLPRRTPVPLVVTGRHESTRDLTEDWLARHGVRVEQLVMWAGAFHPPASLVAPWKARYYAESNCRIFAESDPQQAAIIAQLTGRAVLCPALGRVIPPRETPEPKPPRVPSPHVLAHRRARSCIHRGDEAACGCQAGQARCALGKGSFEGGAICVTSDCLDCPDLSPRPE